MPVDYAPRCQLCGCQAPSRQTTFYQNIGMLVMRRMKTLNAVMCKACVHQNFWKMTSITLLVGWLGTISVIIAPFLVLANIFTYVTRLGMPAAPSPNSVA